MNEKKPPGVPAGAMRPPPELLARHRAELLGQGYTEAQVNVILQEAVVVPRSMMDGEQLIEAAARRLMFGAEDEEKHFTPWRAVFVAGVALAQNGSTGNVAPIGYATLHTDGDLPEVLDKLAEKLEHGLAHIRAQAAAMRAQRSSS